MSGQGMGGSGVGACRTVRVWSGPCSFWTCGIFGIRMHFVLREMLVSQSTVCLLAVKRANAGAGRRTGQEGEGARVQSPLSVSSVLFLPSYLACCCCSSRETVPRQPRPSKAISHPEPGYPPLPTDLHAQLSRFFGTASPFSDIPLRPRLPEV